MTQEPRRRAAADAPTEQIRRPSVRTSLPGPLNLADPPSDGNTEVMSINDLLDASAEPVAPVAGAPTTEPVADPVAIADAPPPAASPPESAPPAMSPPAMSPPAARSAEIRHRLRADSAAALTAARSHSVTWLRTGDNGLIASTAAIALLLLLILMIAR